MEKCTVLVSSCDAYSDLWEAFFKLFTVYWKDCPFKIILNTESKSFSYPNLEIKTYAKYKPGTNVSWGKRFRYHLSKIETPFVLVTLDDFFLQNNVDTAYILRLIDYMKNHDDVAVFSFGECEDKNNKVFLPFPDFYERPWNGAYKYNLQAGIWRTKELFARVKPFEDPWQWEESGNIRSFYDGKKYLTLVDCHKTNIMQYGFSYDGTGGIFHGKWVLGNIQSLFKENGIEIDYEKRGIYTKPKTKLKRNLFNTITKIVKILRSYEFRPKHVIYFITCELKVRRRKKC